MNFQRLGDLFGKIPNYILQSVSAEMAAFHSCPLTVQTVCEFVSQYTESKPFVKFNAMP